ncbi:MAG TPA: uracil-DNA glycosylase [Candidatus Polarisedimenticolia bacterium]|nr:uracil-DNA glycosylase [Candidatus Polarisedimenticolia bacterium]
MIDPRGQLRERLRFLQESGVWAIRRVPVPSPGAFVPPARPSPTLSVASDRDPEAELADLRVEIGDCRRCRLSEKRTQVVFGTGSPRARLMFVGEGPGYEEDRQGLPFVGRAGQLLNRILQAMGMSREEVYIANIVKCRPPENRTPLPDECDTCSPFLFRQIAILRPRVICALGSVAVQTLLKTSSSISRLRGEFRTLEDGTPVMPTFHPAYLLRNPEKKKEVWEDMKKVLALLAESSSR